MKITVRQHKPYCSSITLCVCYKIIVFVVADWRHDVSLNHVSSSISERIKSFGPSLLVLIPTCSATCFQKKYGIATHRDACEIPPIRRIHSQISDQLPSHFIHQHIISVLCIIPGKLDVVMFPSCCTDTTTVMSCKPGIVENQNY
jgi:hypothetical protein